MSDRLMGFIAKKGEAKPTTPETEAPVQKQEADLTGKQVRRTGGTKALTFKVEIDVYERLNEIRFTQKLTAQEILEEALHDWFKKKRY